MRTPTGVLHFALRTGSPRLRIAIIGAAGQLGQDLLIRLQGHQLWAPGHDELDIVDAQQVQQWLYRNRPQVVVNVAAFHDVVRCEAEPETAFAVNTRGPRNLARGCRAVGARLFHVSTDYVFDGTKGVPYVEQDTPSPLMTYGRTKRGGERCLMLEAPTSVVIRSSGLFGHGPCRAKPGGRNFVETMLHLGLARGEVEVVDDQLCCPTYTVDLAHQIAALVERQVDPGVYHAVNSGGGSWYEFARRIFAVAGARGARVKLRPVSSRRFPSPVKRPTDSRLANARLVHIGLDLMRSLPGALEEYLGTSSPAASPGPAVNDGCRPLWVGHGA